MGIPRIGEDYTELRAELARILPEGVGYAVLDPRLPRPGQLYPVEAAAMTRAVPKRVNEFTAGRVAARQAMAMIGLNPAAIPMGDDRAPIWPQGVTGSISHCESACVAVAARAEAVSAIGIDVEENTPLDRDLWNEICRPEEMAWLMDQPEKMRGRLAKRIFCAKEAVYKAVYPRERRMLGFGEVTTVPLRQETCRYIIRTGKSARGCLIACLWPQTPTDPAVPSKTLHDRMKAIIAPVEFPEARPAP